MWTQTHHRQHCRAEGDVSRLPRQISNCTSPYIDAVHITCPKCGKLMTRVPEVIDCWFDSGSMPFAQWHYPFENKDIFDENFPADFISEAVDQTRGWFYTLLAVSAHCCSIRLPIRTASFWDMCRIKTVRRCPSIKATLLTLGMH